nr:hypothetical protein Iba_chr04eCG13670 [Ipomoea batatas]
MDAGRLSESAPVVRGAHPNSRYVPRLLDVLIGIFFSYPGLMVEVMPDVAEDYATTITEAHFSNSVTPKGIRSALPLSRVIIPTILCGIKSSMSLALGVSVDAGAKKSCGVHTAWQLSIVPRAFYARGEGLRSRWKAEREDHNTCRMGVRAEFIPY